MIRQTVIGKLAVGKSTIKQTIAGETSVIRKIIRQIGMVSSNSGHLLIGFMIGCDPFFK